MKKETVINKLEKNAEVFNSLLSGADLPFQQWRPEENKWSLLEIVCHLLDEERLDFRARIKHILETPESEMPSIDPQGWVKEKNYSEWDYDQTLASFIEERKQSLEYLKRLKNINWQSSYQHPLLGEISAEKFLYNWLAHDLLHIRQINTYQYLYFKSNTSIDLSYAGEW